VQEKGEVPIKVAAVWGLLVLWTFRPISFLRLFDDNDGFYDATIGRDVSIARHASVINEHSGDIMLTIWQSKSEKVLAQVWLSGVCRDDGEAAFKGQYRYKHTKWPSRKPS